VNREEAQKALELLRGVVSQARDDTALQNWGIIWIVHAFTNGAAFSSTQWLLWRGYQARWPYIVLWSATLTLNIGLIFLLKARRAGAKTFIETQIWSIWLTFILGVMGTAIVNDLMGLKLLALGPIIAILSAFGFSMMGAVMGRRWYLGTLIFGGASLLMAALPHWQYLILGGVWCLSQLIGGVWLEIDKRKRGHNKIGPHLV
jgi:hypothetical protein